MPRASAVTARDGPIKGSSGDRDMTETIAELVAPQLPYLRRFARALTGSQPSGDAYVVATLETLVADSRSFRQDLSPRLALYKSFLHVWNAMPINRRTTYSGVGLVETADKRIETLTPLPRQAFLLAAIEDFTTDDISTLLDRSALEVVQLLDAAGKEISEQISARVLIIEDEPLISLDIENLVTDIGHKVVSTAATRGEAIAKARDSRPGLVLADIQLADGSSGIDAVNEILLDINVPVIFITAYPERLLTGQRPEPAFLITKPFKPEMVKAVISQALFFDVKAGRDASVAAA
jgi:DNA-directed RNA polymerase specialized sigma24 family protein/CheY-like chemotaxis protein